MTARRVVLWRHGQTSYNIAGRIQGATDIPLDEVGLRQVEAAAECLADGYPPAAIVSSDLCRAQQTAAPLAALTGLDINLDTRLRERTFGQWEGLSSVEIAQKWPDEFAQWRAGRDIPEIGMETRKQAAERIAAAVADAAEGVGEQDTVVVVTHGGAMVCGITRLLGLEADTWLGLRIMGNAHWAVLEPSPQRTPAWRLAVFDQRAPGQSDQTWPPSSSAPRIRDMA